MQHAEEGTLHAYLDGELDAAERAELERHLSVCVPCRNALAEARTFLSESDGMIRALDVATPNAAPAHPRNATRPFVRLTTLAWAASILLAVGLGYSLRNTPLPTPATPVATDEAGTPVAQSAALSPAPTATPPSARGDVAARPSPAAPTPDATAGKVVADARDAANEPPATPTAGAGVSAMASAEPQPAAPRPARALPPVAGSAPEHVAIVDGVPVDTTEARRSFGPANTPAPRRITMDEAVAHLGGTIRLIDGLAPQRVELLAGVDVPGADPAREVIRVYYEEPDLGLVTLDQQRPGPSFGAAARRSTDVSPEAVAVNSAPTLSAQRLTVPGRPATASLTWRTDGTWMMLTSRLSKDQMASLQARVK